MNNGSSAFTPLFCNRQLSARLVGARATLSMLRSCAPLGPIIERWTNSQLLLAEVLNLAYIPTLPNSNPTLTLTQTQTQTQT